MKAGTLCRCMFGKQRLGVHAMCDCAGGLLGWGGGTRAGTSAYVMLAYEMHKIREAELSKSTWRLLTMTPFTQAYHCRCLPSDNAAKVFE